VLPSPKPKPEPPLPVEPPRLEYWHWFWHHASEVLNCAVGGARSICSQLVSDVAVVELVTVTDSDVPVVNDCDVAVVVWTVVVTAEEVVAVSVTDREVSVAVVLRAQMPQVSSHRCAPAHVGQ
jgi:hypothetical protein